MRQFTKILDDATLVTTLICDKKDEEILYKRIKVNYTQLILLRKLLLMVYVVANEILS